MPAFKTARAATTVPVVAGFSALGMSKIVATADMRQRASDVGFSITAYRFIGIAEVAAAAGVARGWKSRAVGIASGGGLLSLLGGAVAVHRRAGAPVKDVLPALGFAGLVGAYVVNQLRS